MSCHFPVVARLSPPHSYWLDGKDLEVLGTFEESLKTLRSDLE
jgi:hypothetical protein